MRIINIKFKRIRVTGFYPRESQVEFEVSFDDGKLKQFHKTLKIQDPKSITKRVFLEIKTMENSTYQKFDGESFLENQLKIVFEDEKKIVKQLNQFFTELSTRVQAVKNITVAEGYIDAIRKVRSMRLEFPYEQG